VNILLWKEKQQREWDEQIGIKRRRRTKVIPIHWRRQKSEGMAQMEMALKGRHERAE
jgi:hypothetical protein